MAVQASVTVSGGSIQPVADIRLRGQGNGEVSIKWSLDTDGWTFTSNGIDLNNSNFQKDGPSNNGKNYTWKRKADGADGSTVKYTINVTNGTTTQTLDPSII